VCRAAGGARKPAEFLCLILKLLQIQPDKEIVIEYIKNEDYKYVRILGERHLLDMRLAACRSSIAGDARKKASTSMSSSRWHPVLRGRL